ncbi:MULTISPECIES: hypothetical protein [Bradyrhizobium]|uniref:Uncharacterized protein n=3 Tax=Bradyrhizobium TaxID=374 RepID=A0AAE5X9N2_9BRAD|nr:MULTISPECIES: hypothetical protein [Bradyrhizobium]MCG2629431.1 hypothetical protein [Bradyrhizobium zhengyangense]MCG2644942.1 hypothetical protein [Bradyrhizobium zhengyangense]MCG2670945.1 hypothetical protein [Bradyrhizobium zhengyangense]MDN4984577.1 hypothetical protein [Bradyrhizobium sp. WYCCWR 13022]MDN5002570.1 hypothetical protein [Bradyrhizobium sp. WYCCWR 12677]
MASVARYVVERSPDQVRLAFKSVLEICKERNISSVTLVVPQKGGFDRTIVAEFLGPNVVKALVKGQPVLVAQGVQMKLESAQTSRGSWSDGLLIGGHISDKDMNKLDDAIGAQAIVYLPWNDTDGKNWRATWGAQIVGATTAPAPTVSLPEPVEEALQSLTQAVNLGTGLNHPSDKKHAERTIAQLRQEGHSFDPVEVRRWAQRNGWSSSAAADLEKVARKAFR